jgi:hypothetical protein
MADVSGSEIQALIEAMQANTAAVIRGRGSSNGNGTNPQDKKAFDEAEKKLTATKMATKAMKEQVLSLTKTDQLFKNTNKSLSKLDDSAGLFQKSLVAAGVAAGALVSVLAKTIPETVDTYRQMLDVGQDFGGSMLQMNKAAAQSRMSLADFAKTVKDNNKVVGSIGTKAFMDMSVGVRESLSQLGMLGLTTDELNGYLGSYMETQRLYGHAERISQAQAVDSTRNFVDNVTKFSALTGKSRKEIMEATSKAMQDVSLSAYQAQLSGEASEALTKSLSKATGYLAALPGEAGSTLSTMLTQAVGRESAWFSDEANKLSSVGLGAVVDMVDSMAQKIKRGEASDEELDAFRSRMVKVGKQNMESLRQMSMSSNATIRQNAAYSIKMINEMSSLSKKTLKEREAQEKITNTLLRVQSAWDQVTGFIREQFFGSLGGILDGFEKSLDKPEFKALQEQVIGYGQQFGAWLKGMSESGLWTKLGNALGLIVDGVVLLTSVVTKVVNAFATVNKSLDGMGLALAGIATYLAVTKGVGMVKDKLNQTFDIGPDPFRKYATGGALRVLMMNGGAGTAGGFGDYDGKNKKTTRGGRAYRAGRSAGRIAGVAGRGLGGAARTAGGALARGGRAIGGMAIGGMGGGAMGSLSKFTPAIKGMAGGVGALVLAGASMAIDNAEDFTGKQLAKLGLAAASGAATGAMFGPLGALAGGIVGAGIELVTNWDAITKDVGDVADKAMGAIKKGFDNMVGIFKFVGSKIRGAFSFFSIDGIKGAFNGAVDFASNVGNQIGASVSAKFTMASDWLKSNVSDFAKSVMGAWDDIKGYDWSGMFSSVGKGIIDTAKMVSPLAGLAISGVSKIMNPTMPMAGPSEVGSTPIKSINEKAFESQMKNLETQISTLKQDYNDLRSQYNKLFDLLAESNVVQKAGLTELVEETKRGNRGIDGLARKL